MRLFKLGLLPFFLATTAHAQTIDANQDGWNLRRGESAFAEPVRLRPAMQPSLVGPAVAPVTQANATPLDPAYTGHSFMGGTLALGIALGTYYDDNVFAGSTNRRSDMVMFARPEFAWQTTGQGYAVGVDGYLEAKRYEQYDSENQLNGGIGTQFKVAPTSDSQVIGSARYVHNRLDRGTSETLSPNGVLLSTLFQAPISYDQGAGSLVYNKRFNEWWTSLGVGGTVIKFENPNVAGIAQVDLGYADGHIETVNARVGRVVAPLTSVFAEVAGNSRTFDVGAFSSKGYRVVGGVLMEAGQGSRVRGEAWAGYMNQDYNGPSFQTVSTFTYGGALSFGLTDQLSLGVEGRREAKEAALSVGVLGPADLGVNNTICAVAAASCVSAIQSLVGGRLDYKILPNLVVGGGAAYIVDQYLGIAAGGRIDRTISPTASLKYAATNRVTFGLDYRRVNFDPSGGAAMSIAAPSYNRNLYLASIAGKF